MGELAATISNGAAGDDPELATLEIAALSWWRSCSDVGGAEASGGHCAAHKVCAL